MKIVCLGSGNVATHIANAFKAAGADLLQIWSRDMEHASLLSAVTGAQAIDDLDLVNPEADLYIIAVKDDAIAEAARRLKGLKGLVVHTSGATSIDILKHSSLTNYGVLYPLQTFSKNKKVEFSQIPLCIEADNSETLTLLKGIAKNISPLIYEINSDQRKILHLAAVFACNFTNHLYQLSNLILEKHGLDFNLLKPLILETAEKVQSALPEDVQTGPAIRNDETTMQEHQKLLQTLPRLKEIYEILSRSIKKTHE